MSVVTTSPPSITQLNFVYACSPHPYPEFSRAAVPTSARRQRRRVIDGTVAPSSPSPQLTQLRDFERLLQQAHGGREVRLDSAARLACSKYSAWLLEEKRHGHRFLLKYAASTPVKLLRCERHGLETESLVLDLLKDRGVSVPVPRKISSGEDKHNALGQPHLLRSYAIGTSSAPFCASFTTLSSTRANDDAMNSSIDASLGTHLRCITAITQQRFGPAHRVLTGSGSKTWAEAFFAMLEGVLRDGEDHLIALPYDSIRFWTAASAGVLADVETAQLVPMGLEDYGNVLLLDDDEQSGPERGRSISCLLGWDDVVFGDPFLSGVFIGKDQGFWRAYAAGNAAVTAGYEGRQMLYTVYRSIVAIVKCHLRPQSSSSSSSNNNNTAAFDARRDLNVALNRLAGQT